jgi:peroxiredoxin
MFFEVCRLHRSLPTLLVVALPLSLAIAASASSNVSVSQRIDEAWEEIRSLSESGETERAKQLQREIGAELFAYYTEHPSTEDGERALSSAFMMWANVGQAEAIDAALPRIDRGSAAWTTLVRSIANGYYNGGRRIHDVTKVLQELQGELTHPESRSALLLSLSDQVLSQGKARKARKLLEEVVALDAEAWYVDRAKGDLYEMDHLQIGDSAPEFEAVDLAGDAIRLVDLRGKVVLLEFWSTTCGPCLPEIPHLRDLAGGYPDDQLVVLGVSLDQNLPALVAFLSKEKMTWPLICDEQGFDGRLAQSYNVTRIPRSYVIDTEGRIASKDVRGEELVTNVRRLVAKSFGPGQVP